MRTWLDRIASRVRDLWHRLWGAPAARAALPSPERRPVDFHAWLAAVVKDAQVDAWVALLRAEGVFPPSRFGAVDAPHSAQEYAERFAAIEAQVSESIARAALSEPAGETLETSEEPEWFLLVADRLVPLGQWFAGVGLPSGSDGADVLQRAEREVQKVMDNPTAQKALASTKSLVERWIPHKTPSPSERPPPRHAAPTAPMPRGVATATAAHVWQLKMHTELLLRAVGAEVSFEFPSVGARVAELSPPPAHGSPTSGVVGRVLCSAVVVTVNGGAVSYRRGAHVRG